MSTLSPTTSGCDRSRSANRLPSSNIVAIAGTAHRDSCLAAERHLSATPVGGRDFPRFSACRGANAAGIELADFMSTGPSDETLRTAWMR